MEAKSGNIKNQMYDWLVSEIYRAEEVGIPVAVDGKVYSSQDADKLNLMMEDSYYMKSYEGDQAGKIVRIDFDHINECLK